MAELPVEVYSTSLDASCVIRSKDHWAGALPAPQGLYDPEHEKDSCGVGFVCHIKGQDSHKVVSDARSLLCNMTHRGATGADSRDGDGAGVMTSIPHEFFTREAIYLGITLPPQGHYAVGNVFFKPDSAIVLQKHKDLFEQIAEAHRLRVLCWREVPRNNSILGPAALSREPLILQPIVTLQSDDPDALFDENRFERQLYVLRKHATRSITLYEWFYICSLSPKVIVYKGQLSPAQVYDYYYDLNHALYQAHFCLVHSRFSTNTFPSWDRAQPLRWAAHNGEINTVRGNKNWMRAREGNLISDRFGDELESLYPIVEEGGSDSAAFDNVLELLVVNGVMTLPEAIMMLVPEAWQNTPDMDPDKVAFYQWAACVMEPWDGPALFTFADGRYCGANLDRNGLRPCRWITTTEDFIICASEVGAISIPPERVSRKGRLQPGKMLLVDTTEGRIVDDTELKMLTARKRPFKQWIKNQQIRLPEILDSLGSSIQVSLAECLDDFRISEDPKLLAFGYTFEQLDLLMRPMVTDGKEALGSMGNDAPLACMATQPRLIYDYFRQLFAQVTNPPIDPIRESIVMSLECYVGAEGNLLALEESQAGRLVLPSPILSVQDFEALRHIKNVKPMWSAKTIDITFEKRAGVSGYSSSLQQICGAASEAVKDHAQRVAVSALAATGAVHHHLIATKERSKVALIVETGEAREVHHLCVLLGYGADGIFPYLAMEAILKLHREGLVKASLSENDLIENYRHATDNGILKVMSKMGISTLQGYKGAQIFEALGLHKTVVDRCFLGTASRIQGTTFELLALDAFDYHERGYPSRDTVLPPGLPESGEYHWRDGGEAHINDPVAIANLQDAVRSKNQLAYDTYSQTSQRQVQAVTLRGLLEFDYSTAQSIPLEEVEPWTELVKRFCTGAMSYGSISSEAHSALAIAMNRLGGKSNTGEGGEDASRSQIMPNGDTMRSAIKQVASGRFGVTSNYLADSDELQIKMAQGAKPGEGGELPGHKVSESIAKTRHSTPGVGLISPPPHHDIYSIEDLKQLIYDLKCANPRARVSVKLVSEVGVGIVASGVAKAKADHILISGHDGGTGASRWTGIKYAGLPWELGLAETHQTLVLNDLRGRVCLQTDGQIRTGRDVAIAAMLGAEEFGFATTPLIAMGCIMMRRCHQNTCPVGVATQDPELRAKFTGQPEHVINFFYYVAEELRSYMAKLGFRTLNEMVGHAELLKVNEAWRNPKTAKIDLSAMLKPAWKLRPGAATHKTKQQDHKMYTRLDNKFIDEAEPALTKSLPVRVEALVKNTDRALGCSISNRVSKAFGEKGLKRDTIHINLGGSAGQSCGAFLAPGITLELEGDANDYVGKGLSGGRMIVYPPKSSIFNAEENVIVGNVCLYGATSGEAYICGISAERFAVRNSGAIAVVEGVGDHGCEYMTGGRVVILGSTGRNFAAGMSGGIAYVLDERQEFQSQVNMEMVELGNVEDDKEIEELKEMIRTHHDLTGSRQAQKIMKDFDKFLPQFVRVMPLDYKAVLNAGVKKAIESDPKKDQVGFDIKGDAFNPAEDKETVNVNQNQEIPPANPSKPEPPVVDLEDAMVDLVAPKKKVEALDKTRGFMKYKRLHEPYRNPRARVKDWAELSNRLAEKELKVQAARCMDCGVPFCQSDTGCPISNVIPKWNDLVFKGQWLEALNRLLMTNNFPEFTGRICPAPCEGACVLGINEAPVGIKSIECAIIDKGFEMGWMTPKPPAHRSGKKVAIVGSGPAGLACADQLNRAGHTVTVYDRNDRHGGLLVYGIPNMKLDKKVVKRRLDLMEAEGIRFVANSHVGVNVEAKELKECHDALVVATGATWPRDLRIGNRDLEGIHFAMEFLQLNTSSLLDSNLENQKYISAKGKNVIVIGGGDTGNDCIGTSLRHGAKSITNFELLPQPPSARANDNPWPQWPKIFRVDYGHTEVETHYGRDPRQYCISTKEFVSDGEGKLKGLNTVRVEWTKDPRGQWKMVEIPGSEQFFECELCLLALGFLGPEQTILKSLGVNQDARSNILTEKGHYLTNVEGVFAAGDCRRGQSLVVCLVLWLNNSSSHITGGIQEGRAAAVEVDNYLLGKIGATRLPYKGGIKKREILWDITA
ncbi:glutamate synthase [NADPH] [Phakopsora pachyrhizi]|uniref:Glutamate synthase [NADH] n=1 Tax=Phakopsora pachyrhizi TaxID=170000 RepID=A0AAV0BD69_PHAPC|nr:glutamate synthase [NADPH] [Phakopsora pachyrhizi]